MLGLVVRVLVPLAIPEAAHEPGHRVAQMERHRIGSGALDVRRQRTRGTLHRVRLRRKREIDARLGKRKVPLREPDEMDRLLGRRRDDERLGIREADVLRREDHETPGDEHGILSRVDHPYQPVQRCVRV